MTLQVNTKNRKGRVNQSATIISDDPNNPQIKIYLSGTIKQIISIEPSYRLRFKGYAGDKISKTVTITSHEEQPLKITEITSDISDQIQYELKTLQEGKKYSLDIKTTAGIKETFQGKIVLKTNSKEKPELEIFVTSKLQKEVKVAPPYIYYGIINTGKEVVDQKSLNRTVTVTRARGGDLTIEKIETGTDWIKSRVENNNKDGKYSVIITLDEDKMSKGEFREKIKIHTKYNKKLEIAHVIIEGKVN